jgi:uncharacterized Zn finger protein
VIVMNLMEEVSWLNPDALRQAAGELSFARGAEYYALGQVLSLAEYRGAIAAAVQGTRRYQVLLRGGGPEHPRAILARCNCPAADGGARCCKHCVAVGLAFLDQPARPTSSPAVALADAADWLGARPQGELVDLLLAEALESESLRERLLLEAANHTGKPIALEPYRRAVELALSKALWSEGEEAGQLYLIELKASLGNLAAARRWEELRAIVAHTLALLEASKRPSPAAIEKLRAFSKWLRQLRLSPEPG